MRAIDGSFALVARDGITVRLARSLDRPMRYFLAKRQDGPALFVADRIDTLHQALADEGLAGQFHPSYTRMVPAHHVDEIAAGRLPRSRSRPTRASSLRARDALPPDLDEIGRRYIGALADEVDKWLRASSATRRRAPIGVRFSGGIDSGAVFLVAYHAMLRLGQSPARLKAFTLDWAAAATLRAGAAISCDALGLSMFLEAIDGRSRATSISTETLRVDRGLQAARRRVRGGGPAAVPRHPRALSRVAATSSTATAATRTSRTIRSRRTRELTIRSVVNNLMLYQEGWGVGSIKHSLTYSGGLSRGYVRTYAPARRYGFDGLQPVHAPGGHRGRRGHPVRRADRLRRATLYALKGEIVAARRARRHRPRHAGLPEAAVPARRRRRGSSRRATARRQRAHVSPAVPRAVRLMTCAPGSPQPTAARSAIASCSRSGPRAPPLDPWRHQGVARRARARRRTAGSSDVATIFLTGRECPWRCVMCDLWQHTIESDTPAGALVRAARIDALAARAQRRYAASST